MGQVPTTENPAEKTASRNVSQPDDVVPSYVAATYNKREALSTLLGAELDRRGVAKPEVKPKKYGGYGGEKIELVYG